MDVRVLEGFKDFLLRGNVVDLAVAVVIGTAFTAVVNSFADSFLTPLIGLVGGGGEFGGTLTIAGQDFTWGAFLSQVISFVLTASVVYFAVVLPMRALMERRRRAEEGGSALPTQVELLVEIRELLRAQQGIGRGPDPSAPGAPSLRSLAGCGLRSVAAPVRGPVLQEAAVVVAPVPGTVAPADVTVVGRAIRPAHLGRRARHRSVGARRRTPRAGGRWLDRLSEALQHTCGRQAGQQRPRHGELAGAGARPDDDQVGGRDGGVDQPPP